ncbi:hypothetical protein VYU27_008957 [Nannochloropsis oceanica]
MPPPRSFPGLAALFLLVVTAHAFFPFQLPAGPRRSPPAASPSAATTAFSRIRAATGTLEKGAFGRFSSSLLRPFLSSSAKASMADAAAASVAAAAASSTEAPKKKTRRGPHKPKTNSTSTVAAANIVSAAAAGTSKKGKTQKPQSKANAALVTAAGEIKKLVSATAAADGVILAPGEKRGPHQPRPKRTPLPPKQKKQQKPAAAATATATSAKALKRQQNMAALQGAIKEEKDGGNVQGKVVFKRELPAVARLPDVDSVEVRRKQQLLKQKEEEAAAALAAVPLPDPALKSETPKQSQHKKKKEAAKSTAEASRAPVAKPSTTPTISKKKTAAGTATAVDPIAAAASKNKRKTKGPKPANATLPAVEAFITSLPLTPNSPRTRNGQVAGISPRPKAPKGSSLPSSSLSTAFPPVSAKHPSQRRPNTTYLSSSPSPFALAKSTKKMYISRRGEITTPGTGNGSAFALASLLSLKDGSTVTPAELRGVVNGCLRRQDWKGLRQLAGSDNGLPVTKDLLDMMVTVTAKAGKSRTARALVDLMILRGIVLDMKSYNALLPAVLAEAPAFLQQEAVDTFLKDLSRRGLSPDRVTFNTILKHHASLGKEALALETLRTMSKTAGVAPDVVSYTTAISACGRDWDGALRVLAQAEGDGNIEKDARLYTAAMRVCASAGKRQEVLDLFERMKAMQAAQTEKGEGKRRKLGGKGESENDLLSMYIAYNAVLEALKMEGDWRQALKVLQDMRQSGLTPNSVNHNTVLDAIAEAGESTEALALLKQMKAGGTKPDKRSYTAVIKSMVKTANIIQGRELFEEMVATGITPDAVTYTTLMELYGQAGNKEQMEQLVQQMSRKRGFPRDVRAFTAVIRAYGRAGLWREALELLGTMKARNVKPTVVSYGTAMAALAASARHVEAFELLETMKREGVEPNQVVMEWAIEACRTAGRLDKIVQLQWKRLTT